MVREALRSLENTHQHQDVDCSPLEEQQREEDQNEEESEQDRNELDESELEEIHESDKLDDLVCLENTKNYWLLFA